MPDNPIHKGSLPPFYNPDAITWTPKVGKTVESTALVLETNVDAFTQPFRDKNLPYHVEPRPGTPYVLVTWIPWDATNVVSIIWERAGNDLEKDIWELPKIRAEFTKLINAKGTTTDADNSGNLYYQWHAFVQRVVNGKVAGEENVPTWKRDTGEAIINQPIFTDKEFKAAFAFLNTQAALPDSTNKITAVDYKVFADLAACLSRGVTSFPVATYAFRRTQILPPKFTLGPAPMLPNAIVTRVQLIAGTSPPPEVQQLMPVGYYQYKTPTVIAQRDGTYQLNEEWYYAEDYDHFIYANFQVPP